MPPATSGLGVSCREGTGTRVNEKERESESKRERESEQDRLIGQTAIAAESSKRRVESKKKKAVTLSPANETSFSSHQWIAGTVEEGVSDVFRSPSTEALSLIN